LVTVANPKLKIKAATAQEICSQYKLSPAAKPHLKEAMAPLDFINALIANKLNDDAVQFLARALPKREAVWWSCLCARDVLQADALPELPTAVETAENWVYRPTEENRRKAQKIGKAIEESHPAKWAAMGAFWSGSLGAPNGPEVKPPEDLTAKAVIGAVMMAATVEPKLTETRFKTFFAYGIDIANGGTGRPLAKQ
jgi:hypothetical protein